MKRIILIVLMAVNLSHAGFYARHLTYNNSWRSFEFKQLSCQVDARGLFYETTIVFEIGLTICYNDTPRVGDYEIRWDFSLPDEAIITDCQMQPVDSASGHFIAAEIVDLTTADERYQTHQKTNPSLLLRQRWERNYDSSLLKSYQMKFSPVHFALRAHKTPVIKISYLTPCVATYNARRIYLPLNEFWVYRICPVTIRYFDPDNPTATPDVVTGIHFSTPWKLINGYWQTTYHTSYFPSQTIVAACPETATRSYLRTFTNEKAQFYQLSILPPLPPENRNPKSILLAVDVTDEGENSLYHYDLFNEFKQAVQLSVSPFDSIAMIYSGFIPLVYDTLFVPVSDKVLTAMFVTLHSAAIPKLNTLPQLLRIAVKFFNDRHQAGEIWLLTNARAHSNPPATAMEIIDQSLNIAEYPLILRIINNDSQYWPYLYINQQRYLGNDYLYENLASLSWRSFVKLR